MKEITLPLLLALATGLCTAQEVGRVISSTPVIQQVSMPRQVCTTQQVTTPGAKSGAGAAMGAIAGGAIGNNIGDGTGRVIATMLGLVGGAILGDRVEGAAPAQVQNVQSCSTQTFYENRVISYNVVYEFNGKQYNVSMPSDPGPFIKLQVSPISAAPLAPAPTVSYVQPSTTLEEVVYARPARIVTRPHSYIRYYDAPPLVFNLELGHHGGSRHGHWR